MDLFNVRTHIHTYTDGGRKEGVETEWKNRKEQFGSMVTQT